MKLFFTLSTALLALTLIGSAALAAPGDGRRGHDGRYDRGDDARYDRGHDARYDRGHDARYDRGHDARYDDYGYVDDYDEARTYYVPDFDRRVQRGMHFREVRRMLRSQMRSRVAQKARMIRAHHGFSRRADRMIHRMQARELQRFENRVSWARARFDHQRRFRDQAAPVYTSAPVYAPTPVSVPGPPPCHLADRY